MVKNHKSEEFSQTLSSINEKVKQFEDKKSSLKSEITLKNFLELIQDSESISEQLSVVLGYAGLKYAENTSSNEVASLVTKMSIFATEVSNRLLFFDLWFKKDLDENNANRLIKETPNVYQDYLTQERSLSKFTLQEQEEKIINILDVTGIEALLQDI